jgi:hypothetical protein
MTKEERENFLMKGDKFRESREILYGFMLENMDDEHRMLSRNNLVMKVLGKNGHNLDISGTQYQFITAYCDFIIFHIHLQYSVVTSALCFLVFPCRNNSFGVEKSY